MLDLVAALEVWTNPIIVGLVIGIPTTALGLLAYRRTERLDRDAAQKAVIAAQGDAVQRVINGLDRMVDNLQSDNLAVRQRAAELSSELKECNENNAELKRMFGG